MAKPIYEPTKGQLSAFAGMLRAAHSTSKGKAKPLAFGNAALPGGVGTAG